MSKNYKVTITLTNDKKINLVLNENDAPLSVNQFITLAKNNYYNGTIFHRVIDGFMIQTGGYKIEDNSLVELEDVPTIKGEFASNGYNNPISHKLGVISMARTNVKDSATSQFFICSADCAFLDGEYAAFGRCADEDSLEVVKEVAKVQTYAPHPAFSDFPVEPIGIKSVEVEDVE
jgi:peptidyl-prolyl cis-trans isomerase B (cyclophilin B)